MKVSKKQKSSAAGIIIVVLAAALSQLGLLKPNDRQDVQDTNQPTIEVVQNAPDASSPSTIEYPSQQSSSSYRVDRMEIPKGYSLGKGQRIDHTGHSLYYNEDLKTPIWVAWEVTREEASRRNVEREVEFNPDPKIDGAKAYFYDYNSSGYDRGHMAPAGDMKWDSNAMEEVFYMSNICPQNHELNAGDWNDLEMKTRYWAKKYGKVYVACGPIYRTKQPKRIGTHRVAVPDAFFKVILFNKGKNNPVAAGFLFENNEEHKQLQDRMVTVDELEKLLNMNFFSMMPDKIENEIEAELPELFN